MQIMSRITAAEESDGRDSSYGPKTNHDRVLSKTQSGFDCTFDLAQSRRSSDHTRSLVHQTPLLLWFC